MPVELTPEEKARLKDIDAFNASIAETGWRVSEKFIRENLSRVRLVNSTLTGVEIINVEWKSAVLRDTRFTGSELTLCDFAGATLTNVVFEDCVFKSVSFSTATLEGCRFLRCRMEMLRARDAVFTKCTFENYEELSGVYGGSKLRELSFVNSKFDHTSIQMAEINRVQMKTCQFRSVIFGQITGSNLIFEGSGLNNCGFVDSTYGNLAVDRGVLRAVTFDNFAVERALFKSCPAIQSLTVLYSTWKEPVFTDCGAVTELRLDQTRLLNPSVVRCQVAFFRLMESRVAGGTISECQIGSADFDGTSAAGLRLEGTAFLGTLSIANATFEALTLTNVTYGPEFRARSEGVRYGERSARFRGTEE